MLSAVLSPAQALNLGCQCRTLNVEQLRDELETDASLRGMTQELAQTHPHLFSASAVFLDARCQQALVQAIAALERVIALAPYQQWALAHAPSIAHLAFGPAGVFMGYDFHLTDSCVKLIEINTNAGGALINAPLARAHRSCCQSMDLLFGIPADLVQAEQTFMTMFLSEWQAQRGTAPLRNVIIVDDAPDAQYLAPEFRLARQLFEQQGIHARVADPQELQWRDGALWHPSLPDGQAVDLVYNRLTDFDLSAPNHGALRQAYEAGAAVVTPHPRAHALFANKRNLVALSDDALLASWGVADADRALLRNVVPRTQVVTPTNAQELWANRRQLFFKPLAGYGGKAVYRGDKLTRRVWADIVAGDYVAQTLVPPSERLVDVDGTATHLKLDLRAYTYRGQVQLLAARTYAGQTTNMRTAGGGFSPVLVLPDITLSSPSP